MAEIERNHRITARRRDGANVTPLELFFDLVFVLAVTQCTSLMGSGHTWSTVGQGLLALGVLWWVWVGYSWLTSVVDPDDGVVRVVVFVAMAAMLVIALCVPEVFDSTGVGLTFAGAYAVVRAAHIWLFAIASDDDPMLRRSVMGLAGGTAVGVSLIGVAALCDGGVKAAVWLAAIVIDMAVPFVFGSEGWRLEPDHFVERHYLIVIIALGESIVALGVGAEVGVSVGVVVAAVLGVLLACAMWWSYFDSGSIAAARVLTEMPAGRERNELARDGWSFLHLPIVAGVVLVALAMEEALLHVTEPLGWIGSVALGGGAAVYLLGQVANKWRAAGVVARQRVVAALALLVGIVGFHEVDAWVALVGAAAVLWILVVYELWYYADHRAELREWNHDHAHHEADTGTEPDRRPPGEAG